MFETMTRAGARGVALTALLCTGIALSACTTMGTGSGSVSPGGEAVKFSWKSRAAARWMPSSRPQRRTSTATLNT